MEKVKKIMEEQKEEVQTQVSEVVLTSEDEMHVRLMMEASVFYGYNRSRTNPKMRPYILATRSGLEVINLLKTMEALDKAKKTIEGVVKSGGMLFFVGTAPATKKVVQETAEKVGASYVTERWLGGTFTNFKTISGRINHFRTLKEDQSSGRIEKYTKKERLQISKELKRLEKFFIGMEKMDKLPSMVFIADLKENLVAAREARRMHIPIVALVNTDGDPKFADYPIPANTRSPKSVALVMSYIEKSIEKAQTSTLMQKKQKEDENINDK
ncbi:MAG: 30S ribosomal protein S2 [bacterium]